jgi:hypothetical protein
MRNFTVADNSYGREWRAAGGSPGHQRGQYLPGRFRGKRSLT